MHIAHGKFIELHLVAFSMVSHKKTLIVYYSPWKPRRVLVVAFFSLFSSRAQTTRWRSKHYDTWAHFKLQHHRPNNSRKNCFYIFFSSLSGSNTRVQFGGKKSTKNKKKTLAHIHTHFKHPKPFEMFICWQGFAVSLQLCFVASVRWHFSQFDQIVHRFSVGFCTIRPSEHNFISPHSTIWCNKIQFEYCSRAFSVAIDTACDLFLVLSFERTLELCSCNDLWWFFVFNFTKLLSIAVILSICIWNRCAHSTPWSFTAINLAMHFTIGQAVICCSLHLTPLAPNRKMLTPKTTLYTK